MATNTNNVKKPCCKCSKGGSTFTCNGCERWFCLKHTADHRQELTEQMDNIGQQHDVLKRDVAEHSVGKTILLQIDRWEQESIEKIRSSAEKARFELQRFMAESKTRVNAMIGRLSDELLSKREDDDYTEEDLNRWTNQIQTLRKELEETLTISFGEDVSSLIRLLKLQTRNKHEINSVSLPRPVEEKLNFTMGPVVLSKAGYCATCISNESSVTSRTTYSSIFGNGQYSHDISHVRFLLKTSKESSIFVGVVTLTEAISYQSSALKSAYGYWTDGCPWHAGHRLSDYEKIVAQPNDKALLIIDCPSSTVTYFHERTQQQREMKVNQKKCPLPWKLVVTLFYPNDSIELLQN